MPTVKQVLNDPKFYEKDGPVRLGIMKKLDPNFGNLSIEAQRKVVKWEGLSEPKIKDLPPRMLPPEPVTRQQWEPGATEADPRSLIEGMAAPQPKVNPARAEFFAERGIEEDPTLAPPDVDPVQTLVDAGTAFGTGGMSLAPRVAKAATTIPVSGLTEVVGGRLAESGHPIAGLLASILLGHKLQPGRTTPGLWESKLPPEKQALAKIVREGLPGEAPSTSVFDPSKGLPISPQAYSPIESFAKSDQHLFPSGTYATSKLQKKLITEIEKTTGQKLDELPKVARAELPSVYGKAVPEVHRNMKETVDTSYEKWLDSFKQKTPPGHENTPYSGLSANSDEFQQIWAANPNLRHQMNLYAHTTGWGRVEMTNTQKKIQELIDAKGVDDDAKEWLRQWNRNEMSPEELNAFQKPHSALDTKTGFWDVFWNKKGFMRQEGRRLLDKIEDDLKAYDTKYGSDTLSAFVQAKENSKMTHVFSKMVKKLDFPLERDPDKIVDYMSTRATPKQLQVFKNNLPEDTWDIFKNRMVQNLYESAMIIPEGQHVKRYYPIKFVDAFEKMEYRLDKLLKPEEFKKLKEWVELNKAIAADFARYDKPGKYTESLTKQGIVSASLAAVGVPYELSIAVPTAFSYLKARSLMKPSGLLRGLTTGGPPAKMPRVEHMQLDKFPPALGKKEDR